MGKIKKTLESIMYGVPIVLASFLNMKDASGQMAKKDYFSNIEADCQPIRIEKPNTLYLTFQPTDFGLGLRYDRRISKFGIYSSLSRGNYTLGEGNYIKNHIKATIGGIRYSRKNPVEGYTEFFSCGISYSTYGKKHYPFGTIDETKLRPLSIELGVGVRFKEDICVFLSYNLGETDGILGGGASFRF